MSQTNRRKFFSRGVAAATAATAAASSGEAQNRPTKRVLWLGKKPDTTPLFSPGVAYGNLVFLSGTGYHKEGDIKVHTEHVLDELKSKLEAAGSSMSKVLKCSVFLADLKDYDEMNKVFLGKFGDEPPARTTVAAAGVPGNSLIEIDVIAYI